MKPTKKRIQIFDIAKGISIILMTIGRYSFVDLYPYLVQFQNIVMVIKMPLFIFISGYLFSNTLNFKHFLYHKIDSLLKPLLSFILSLTLLFIIFNIAVNDVVTFNHIFGPIADLARYFYHGSFDVINVSFWFIGALFLGQLTLKAFLEIEAVSKPLKYLLTVAFFSILLILNTIKVKFYWTEYIPIFFTYLILGYSFRKICTRFLGGNSFFYSSKMIIFPILFFASRFTLDRLNIDVNFNLAVLQYNFHYLLLISLLGVFTVIFLCRYIEKIPILNSFLVYCSKASFFILAYHIFIKDVYEILFDLKTYNPILHSLLLFSNILICCLIYMLLKKVPFVRIVFYPLKGIALNKSEIKLLKAKHINRLIPKDIFQELEVR